MTWLLLISSFYDQIFENLSSLRENWELDHILYTVPEHM